MKTATRAAVLVVLMLGMVAGAATAAPASNFTQARAYIRHHGADANRVQANVLLAELALYTLQHHPTQGNLNKLALAAQSSHDNLNAIRDDFADTGSGAFGNAELLAFSGANDLKNSMGALVAWAGNPNAATLAHFSSQYTEARYEWNTGIRAIWRMAHRRKPPTV